MNRIVHIGEFCEHYKISDKLKKQFDIESNTERITEQEFDYYKDLWTKNMGNEDVEVEPAHMVNTRKLNLPAPDHLSDTLYDSETTYKREDLIISSDLSSHSNKLNHQTLKINTNTYAANNEPYNYRTRTEQFFENTLVDSDSNYALSGPQNIFTNANYNSENSTDFRIDNTPREDMLLHTSSDLLENNFMPISSEIINESMSAENDYKPVIIESSPEAYIIQTSDF